MIETIVRIEFSAYKIVRIECSMRTQSSIAQDEKHNKTILRKEANKNTIAERNCNCRAKNACPLQGEYQTKAVIYQAVVTNKATSSNLRWPY